MPDIASTGSHIVGYGPDAFQRLAALIAEAKTKDIFAPVTVVAPSPYAGLSLRRQLASAAGVVNVRFMVLPRLAEYLGSPRLVAEGKSPLSSLVEMAAIRETGSGMAGEGPLGAIADHPKLHSSLSNSFRDLDRLTKEQLNSVRAADPLRAQMIAWRERFLDLVSSYYSREELSWSASEGVEDGSAAPALRDLGFIIFHLLQDPSPAETSLIESLAKAGRCAAIIGVVGEEPIDRQAKRLVTKMEPVLGQSSEEPVPGSILNVDHLLSAPDAVEEVRWVLRKILNRAEEGQTFNRVAVLYPAGGPYQSLVSSQFRMAGVPLSGPDPALLSETPPGKVLALFLEVMESDYSREAVMRWLSESPISPSYGDLDSSGQAAVWDLVSRNAGVLKGLDQWAERLKRYEAALSNRIEAADPLDETSPAKLRGLQQLRSAAAGLARFMAGLGRNNPPAETAPWATFASWAQDVLRHYAPKSDEWREQDQASMDQIMDLLEDIKGLESVSEKTDFPLFRRVLSDALGISRGQIGATGSGVFSAPLQNSLGMDFDELYVLGMSEGGFPRRSREDPMLPETVLQSAGAGDVMGSIHDQRATERRTFLAVLNSAPRRVLCYPRTDPSAQRGQYPSPWFLECAGLLSGSMVGSEDLRVLREESWLTIIDSPEDALSMGDGLSPADTHDYDLASVAKWRSLGLPVSSHYLAGPQGEIDRCLSLESGRDSELLSEWDGRLTSLADQTSRFHIGAENVFSPTRLERWATCPFRYFLGDVLGLSALESPEELLTISPLERGILVHRILERFIGGIVQEGRLPNAGEPWTKDHRSRLEEIAQEEFNEVEARGITGRPLLWSVAKDELTRDLSAFLDIEEEWRAETGYSPLWVERRFGFSGDQDSLPPVILTLDDGAEIRFRGVIDRVDTGDSGNHVAVTDYKSGSNFSYQDMKDDPLGAGRHLQLPVYAMAVRESLGADVGIKSQYWFVSASSRYERKEVPLVDVESRLADVTKQIVSGIKGGVFPAVPGPPGRFGEPRNCRYCDFDKVCPSNREALWERKQEDPLVDLYHDLTLNKREDQDA